MMSNINITSSHLHGVVLFSQVLSIPTMGRMMLLAIDSQSKVLEVVKTVFPLYSFWNSDFFCSIILDICQNVDTLESLALD